MLDLFPPFFHPWHNKILTRSNVTPLHVQPAHWHTPSQARVFLIGGIQYPFSRKLTNTFPPWGTVTLYTVLMAKRPYSALFSRCQISITRLCSRVPFRPVHLPWGTQSPSDISECFFFAGQQSRVSIPKLELVSAEDQSTHQRTTSISVLVNPKGGNIQTQDFGCRQHNNTRWSANFPQSHFGERRVGEQYFFAMGPRKGGTKPPTERRTVEMVKDRSKKGPGLEIKYQTTKIAVFSTQHV